MSISIDNWAGITSKENSTQAADRELILRIITSAKKDNKYVIDPGTVKEYTSAADVIADFGSTSPEAGVASKYFSFVSLSGTKPEKISFYTPGYFTTTAVMTANGSEKNFETQTYYNEGDSIAAETKIAEDYAVSLNRMIALNDNFATVMFVGGYSIENKDSSNICEAQYTLSEPEILDASSASGTGVENLTRRWGWSANVIAQTLATYNNKFRYALHVNLENLAVQTGSISWKVLEAAPEATKTNDNDAATYLSRIAKTGVNVVLDDATKESKTTYPEWLTCALLAATKYANSNSTIIHEFKDVNSEQMNVTCDCDQLYNVLSNLNVSFFGRTQKAGKNLTFFMGGYNLDGQDTAIYDNEIWFKDRVVTEIINRFTGANKLPAGVIGTSIVKMAIEGVISEALTNLVVTPEKEIDAATRAAIIQNTGSTEAPNQLYLEGYYLDVRELTPDVVGKAKRRKIAYILYYSTGEGIRKVEGSDILI